MHSIKAPPQKQVAENFPHDLVLVVLGVVFLALVPAVALPLLLGDSFLCESGYATTAWRGAEL